MKNGLQNFLIKISDLSTYRSSLMGVAVIYVFLYHTVLEWAPTWLYKITCNGDVGVDMFIFLSALGLSFSMNKNPKILEFYWRRVLRIFPTYWLSISVVFVFVIFIIKFFHAPANYLVHPRSFVECLGNYTTFGFWYNGGINRYAWYDWYVPSILVLYIFFPFLYKAMRRTRLTLILFFLPFLVYMIYEFQFKWWYVCLWMRIGIFVLGAFFYYLLAKEYTRWKACFILFVGCFSPFIYAYTDFLNTGCLVVDKSLFSIVLICSMLSFCQLCKYVNIINISLKFLGSISLEFYLIHQQLLRVVITISNKFIMMSYASQVILCFFISLSGAIAIQKVVNILKKDFLYNI